MLLDHTQAIGNLCTAPRVEGTALGQGLHVLDSFQNLCRSRQLS